MHEILVLGIGNLILRDEGIGIHVIQELEKDDAFAQKVDLLDGGTGGYFLVHEVAKYKHIVLVDASLDDFSTGTVRVIHPKFASDYPPMLSAHEFGLKHMIDALIFLETIPEIHLVVISVEDYQEIGLEMSEQVSEAIPIAIKSVKEIVEQIVQETKVPHLKNEVIQLN